MTTSNEILATDKAIFPVSPLHRLTLSESQSLWQSWRDGTGSIGSFMPRKETREAGVLYAAFVDLRRTPRYELNYYVRGVSEEEALRLVAEINESHAEQLRASFRIAGLPLEARRASLPIPFSVTLTIE